MCLTSISLTRSPEPSLIFLSQAKDLGQVWQLGEEAEERPRLPRGVVGINSRRTGRAACVAARPAAGTSAAEVKTARRPGGPRRQRRRRGHGRRGRWPNASEQARGRRRGRRRPRLPYGLGDWRRPRRRRRSPSWRRPPSARRRRRRLQRAWGRQRRLKLVREWVEAQYVSSSAVEDEGALRLADVVPADRLVAELEDELWAVVDLQGLALGLK